MRLFTDATTMRRKTLSRYDNLASLRYSLSKAFCYTLFDIKAQFIIRKEEPTVLARRTSYDKETLARQVIPLTSGYRTALSSRPKSVFHTLYEIVNIKYSMNVFSVVLVRSRKSRFE